MDLRMLARKRERELTNPQKPSPWKRGRNEWECEYWKGQYVSVIMNGIDEPFDKFKYVNMDLDIATKRAALKVAASVVGLSSHRREDGQTLFNASGTIYQTSKNEDGRYLSRIVTSASLFGFAADDIEVKVYSVGGKMFDGIIVGYDAHYNLAIINIISDGQMPAATLRHLDDAVSVHPALAQSSRDKLLQRPHSRDFRICAGDMVVALGRNCRNFDLMAAPGKFSLDDCGNDCLELMMATSLITKPGVGGPLVNCYGEVVGVNFMKEQFTPFLAVNIVAKWLNLYDRYEKFCRPWTGLVATNLYATSIKEMNRIVLNKPEVSRGVFVKRIHAGSPAHRVGLKPHDVIIQCNGREVKGFLEFYCKLLSKCGSCVEVGVVRKGHDGVLEFKIPVEQCDRNNLNKWPLPKEHSQRIVRGRRG